MINQAIASQQQDQQRHQQQQQNLQQQQQQHTQQQQNLQSSQQTNNNNNSSAALQSMNSVSSAGNQYQLPQLSLNLHGQLQSPLQMQPPYQNFAIKPVPLSSSLANTQHLNQNSNTNSSSNESSSQNNTYLVQPSHNFQVINDDSDGIYNDC